MGRTTSTTRPSAWRMPCDFGACLGLVRPVIARLLLTRFNNFSSGKGALGAGRVVGDGAGIGRGLGSGEPVASFYLLLE